MSVWRSRRDGVPLPLSDFEEWCLDAQEEPVQYNRVRRRLFDRLVSLVKQGRINSNKPEEDRDDRLYGLANADFATIKSALTSKQDAFNDDKRLALETAVADQIGWIALIDEKQVDDEKLLSEVGRGRAQAPHQAPSAPKKNGSGAQQQQSPSRSRSLSPQGSPKFGKIINI